MWVCSVCAGRVGVVACLAADEADKEFEGCVSV